VYLNYTDDGVSTISSETALTSELYLCVDHNYMRGVMLQMVKMDV